MREAGIAPSHSTPPVKRGLARLAEDRIAFNTKTASIVSLLRHTPDATNTRRLLLRMSVFRYTVAKNPLH